MKRKARPGRLDTYIGEGTSLEGSLTSEENLTVYGRVKGAIECRGRVTVGETGNVEADITADDVVVSGRIVGNVTAKSKLEMVSTGSIQGDIKTSRLTIEDGSKLEGHCEMVLDGKPVVVENIGDRNVPSEEKTNLPDLG
jgi:cytoskeletal protein CcmA (bactofilin family)